MSSDNEDRKTRSISGRSLPNLPGARLGAGRLAEVVSTALRLDYGDTHAATKILVGLTGANKRAVKNWLEARNSPNGDSLVALCRHSDRVLEAFLILAGREKILKTKSLIDARARLREILQLLEALDA